MRWRSKGIIIIFSYFPVSCSISDRFQKILFWSKIIPILKFIVDTQFL